jgi:hypothetical protein
LIVLPSGRRPDMDNKKIIVVEDEKIVALEIERVLQKSG